MIISSEAPNLIAKKTRFISLLQSFSQIASVTVLLTCGIVVLGWLLDIAILKGVLPGLVTMKANTAIGFILGGSSLWLWHNWPGVKSTKAAKNRLFSILPQACAILVLLIGLLTLIQYGFGWNLGIDELIFKDVAGAVGTSAPGRMSPNSALNFLMLGSALLLLHKRVYSPAQCFSFAGFLIGFLGLLGHIYGVTYFYGKSYTTGMALHTAIAFILLSVGILFACPDKGLMIPITSEHAGGIMARHLSPAVIVISPLLGWVILLGYRVEIYNTEAAISLMKVLNLVLFEVLIWFNAKFLGLLDSQRQQAEISLKQANEDLEARVEERTLQLRQKNQQLEHTLQELQRTQSQLIQSDKMSSLGQLVAGVAHEINNPVNFIYGNVSHANEYAAELLSLVKLYQKHYPNPNPEIQEKIEDIELDFLVQDFSKLLSSMKVGAERIYEIVRSLRNFSRLDEAEMKDVDIHEGIDSTLMILQNRLKAKVNCPNIQIIKEYGNLPKIECYAGQLNQVFMNLIANGIDALEMKRGAWCIGCDEKLEKPCAEQSTPYIRIRTEVSDRNWIAIKIADNGPGMTEAVKQNIFNPFFTTKPVGKGTGLGLAISYQIVVEKHGGKLECVSAPGQGTELVIEIPIRPIV